MKFYVGYQIELDEIFIYAIDWNNLVWTFKNGVIDSIFFYEYINKTNWIELGEL